MIRPLTLDTLTPLAPIIGLENGIKNSTSAIPDVVYPISHTLNDAELPFVKYGLNEFPPANPKYKSDLDVSLGAVMSPPHPTVSAFERVVSDPPLPIINEYAFEAS